MPVFPESYFQQLLQPHSRWQSRNSPYNLKRQCTHSSLYPVKVTTKHSVLPELEIKVKGLYNGTCVITRIDTSWSGAVMISDHAVQACHIIPKSMPRWFPRIDDVSEQELWDRTNSVHNCILTDSTTHGIRNFRLLAMEHVRLRRHRKNQPLMRK